MSLLAPTLQLFFAERLAKQRQASPATITSYRNTFRLLLGFVQNRTGKAPSTLDWTDLDVRADLGLPGPPRNRPAQQRT